MSLLLDAKIWLLVLLASALGTAAMATYYYLGKKGVDAVLHRFPKLEVERWNRVQLLYEEYGSGLAFLSALPVVGMLFSAVAGAVGLMLPTFLFWVLLGRIVRNWTLVLLIGQTLALLLGE